jgi:signal transduction histidine kinase
VNELEGASGAVEASDDAADTSAMRAAVSAAVSASSPARWLRILQGVSEGAVSHLDLAELLHDLLGRIRGAMGVDNAAILLVSEDGAYLNLYNLYAARGPEEDVTGTVRIAMGRGVAGSIAASGRPLIIDDLSQVEVEHPLLRATVHSLLGVPLLLGGRVIGVIHVGSASPRSFTEEESQLLQVLAGQVALAVEHARLYESERAARREAEEVTRRLEALQAISDAAMEHARLGELLRAMLPRIQQLMEVDNVAILLPEANGRDLALYSVRGPEEAVMGKVHVPFGEGVAGTIAARREPLIVENLASVPVANPFLREHFTSLLGVPLLHEGQLIGVIHVDSVAPRRFTEDESRLLQMLAGRIAVAIARAAEYEHEEAGRVAAEREVAVLHDATERMDEFLGIASHELRTPLTSLTMNVQMLDHWLTAERGRGADEPAATYAQRAIAAVRPLILRSSQSLKRLDRLVGDLLDATRVREGRLGLRLCRVDLAQLLRDTVEEHRQTHAGRDVQLSVEAQEPIVVMVDPDRIAQVVSNLLGNALKYSLADRAISVTLGVAGDQARVAVRDRGIGIGAGALDRVWDRFYRAAGVTHQTGSQVGLGLGLYISRDIVERHGGRVGARSTPGKGSTFWFTVPLARGDEGDEAGEKQ